MEKMSIVIPAYNEEIMVLKAYQTISTLLKTHGISYEFVFVDDGSKDNTWESISSIEDMDVKGLHFSRNFGKESAIFAGLEASTGDCVAVMDCDLQHPPETLIEMFDLWKNGYEIVEGVKLDRGKENPIHKFCSETFYKIMSKAMHLNMKDASDFKCMDRKVVGAILSMKEQQPFFRAMSSWVGYKKITVGYYVQEREFGESKWSIFSLIKYAISNITGYSTFPLQIVTVLGCLTLFFTFLMGIQTIIHYVSGNSLEGFTTVILLILFIGSLLMISLGIIGYYLARIYMEMKQRPRYLVSEKK